MCHVHLHIDSLSVDEGQSGHISLLNAITGIDPLGQSGCKHYLVGETDTNYLHKWT